MGEGVSYPALRIKLVGLARPNPFHQSFWATEASGISVSWFMGHVRSFAVQSMPKGRTLAHILQLPSIHFVSTGSCAWLELFTLFQSVNNGEPENEIGGYIFLPIET